MSKFSLKDRKAKSKAQEYSLKMTKLLASRKVILELKTQFKRNAGKGVFYFLANYKLK